MTSLRTSSPKTGPAPLPPAAPVTLEMIYGAILSLARAVAALRPEPDGGGK